MNDRSNMVDIGGGFVCRMDQNGVDIFSCGAGFISIDERGTIALRDFLLLHFPVESPIPSSGVWRLDGETRVTRAAFEEMCRRAAAYEKAVERAKVGERPAMLSLRQSAALSLQADLAAGAFEEGKP